jgi:hypothetical protein
MAHICDLRKRAIDADVLQIEHRNPFNHNSFRCLLHGFSLFELPATPGKILSP